MVPGAKSPNLQSASFTSTGFFKICHDTRYGMDGFFGLRFKNQLYGNKKNQIDQNPIIFYWRYT